jgi:hypothetical protein
MVVGSSAVQVGYMNYELSVERECGFPFLEGRE